MVGVNMVVGLQICSRTTDMMGVNMVVGLQI